MPLSEDQISNRLMTDYCGNLIYENGELKKVLIDGGYISFTGNGPSYYFYVRDHQGNNRVVLADIGGMEESNHYYPFGGLFGESSRSTDTDPYKYNGKELDRMHGLNWYDYSARQYDPMGGGGFPSMDPLCEKYYSVSPYAYCGNNPVRFVDPTGMLFGDYYDRKGNYLGNDGKDDGKVYLLNAGMRARTEENSINWGGTLLEKHTMQLQNSSTEVCGLIIQDRIEEGSDYTISELKTVGGDKNVTGYILEPAGPSTTVPNQDKRIPEGVYNLENYSSKKYPDNFRLSNEEVPKSRLILYHAGNNGRNTEGCNMPGTTKGDGVIGGSKAKMQELRRFIESKEASNVKTIINNKIPEKKR